MPTIISDNLKKPQKQFDGLLMCARYAFMPNKLQYCGGTKNQDLFEYSTNKKSEPALGHLLEEFQTLYPYLKLIADSNSIKDVFDYRVVEAYWLGNKLLDNVNMNKLYRHFIDGLNLKKKIKHSEFEKLVGKIPQGALPHHSFHVFNVYFRTGHIAVKHSLETMNSCCINWGKITKVNDTTLKILTPVLISKNEKLLFSEPKTKTVSYKFLDRTFIASPKIGEFITVHWDWACEVITPQQKDNLEKYTNICLKLANKKTQLKVF